MSGPEQLDSAETDRLRKVCVQLAEALIALDHNPFGVGQYKQTEAALAAYYALGALGVTSTEENAG